MQKTKHYMIVKLLMRFYKLNEGQILVDGKNINVIDDNTYKNLFGMVLQDTWVFSGTIMENIRYGKLNATDERSIKQAAKSAHAHHFIKTLPDGYNMELNEDSNNISGEKQLLTIARELS